MLEPIHIGGVTLRFLHSRHDTADSLDIFEMTLQPNAAMPVPHYHRDWDETVYGLTGTSTWVIDGHATEVGPGESAFIRRGIVHGFTNPSGALATCLSVLTPGVLGPEYFQELAALLAAGKPDPAKVREVMLRYGLVPEGDEG
jgi:quercetin dioxygenase-like cupin family protein